jgi:hypothetical protein
VESKLMDITIRTVPGENNKPAWLRVCCEGRC